MNENRSVKVPNRRGILGVGAGLAATIVTSRFARATHEPGHPPCLVVVDETDSSSRFFLAGFNAARQLLQASGISQLQQLAITPLFVNGRDVASAVAKIDRAIADRRYAFCIVHYMTAVAFASTSRFPGVVISDSVPFRTVTNRNVLEFCADGAAFLEGLRQILEQLRARRGSRLRTFALSASNTVETMDQFLRQLPAVELSAIRSFEANGPLPSERLDVGIIDFRALRANESAGQAFLRRIAESFRPETALAVLAPWDSAASIATALGNRVHSFVGMHDLRANAPSTPDVAFLRQLAQAAPDLPRGTISVDFALGGSVMSYLARVIARAPRVADAYREFLFGRILNRGEIAMPWDGVDVREGQMRNTLARPVTIVR